MAKENYYTNRNCFSWKLNDLMNDDGSLYEFLDQDITPREAIDILEECENEETDRGLWEGLSPLDAVKAMGFWSYRNDIQFKVEELIGEKLQEYANEKDSELDEMNNQLIELESSDLFDELDEDTQSSVQEKILNLTEAIESLEDMLSNIQSAIDTL